jgi:hypothetical protein
VCQNARFAQEAGAAPRGGTRVALRLASNLALRPNTEELMENIDLLIVDDDDVDGGQEVGRFDGQ